MLNIDMKITIDTRCCNKNKIAIEDFKNMIHEKLSNYTIEYEYSKSTSDSICESGCILIEFINVVEDKQKDIKNLLKNIFDDLSNIIK